MNDTIRSSICLACSSDRIEKIDYIEGALFLCHECGLQWGVPADGPPNSRSALSQDYYMTAESFGEARQYPPFCRFFDVIGDRFGARKLTVLDVGCGNGVFIQQCLMRGHDARGIEVDPRLKGRMAAEVSERVQFTDIRQADLSGALFDVVTFWDSFEHIRDLFGVLDIVKKHLRPGGVLYLRVNNNRDIYNFLSLGVYRIFRPAGKFMLKQCFHFPEHLYNFSPAGMEKICQRTGWNIIAKNIGETPASRLTPHLLLRGAIRFFYLINRMIGGGKIGNYYLTPA